MIGQAENFDRRAAHLRVGSAARQYRLDFGTLTPFGIPPDIAGTSTKPPSYSGSFPIPATFGQPGQTTNDFYQPRQFQVAARVRAEVQRMAETAGQGSAMGAHYRHTTPEMAARVIDAIQQRLAIVLAVADESLENNPNRSTLRVF